MPRRNRNVLLALFGLSLFAWIAAQGGIAAPRGPLRYVKGFPGSHLDYENVNLFIDVMQHVDQNYVRELTKEDRRKFTEQAIEAGLHTLDEHSGFMNKHEYRSFRKQSDGSFGGIGVNIVIARDTRRLTIVSPMVGSPAYRANIKPGDQIEKINGVPTDNITADEAVERITGKIGEPVTLTIRSRGSLRSRDVTLIREEIKVESVLGDQRDAGQHWDFMIDKTHRLGYIRLAAFGRKSTDELKAALAKLKEQGVQGLVLDLRGNPGGQLEAAVAVANLFLPHGRIVSVEGRTRAPEIHDARPGEVVLPPGGYPLAVLINEGSASASEIVAAALQDNQRAVLFGERTFGKGSVQNLIEMENGASAVKITIAKYVRPSGKNIHRFPGMKEDGEWGVKPDVEVKLAPNEELDFWLGRRDRDIVRKEPTAEERRSQAAAVAGPLASSWLLTSPAGGPLMLADLALAVEQLPAPPRPYQDKVLEQALDYLRKVQTVKSADVRPG